MNLRPSPRFSFLLVILVVLVGVKIYRIWEEGLPELPGPVTEKSTVSVRQILLRRTYLNQSVVQAVKR